MHQQRLSSSPSPTRVVAAAAGADGGVQTWVKDALVGDCESESCVAPKSGSPSQPRRPSHHHHHPHHSHAHSSRSLSPSPSSPDLTTSHSTTTASDSEDCRADHDNHADASDSDNESADSDSDDDDVGIVVPVHFNFAPGSRPPVVTANGSKLRLEGVGQGARPGMHSRSYSSGAAIRGSSVGTGSTARAPGPAPTPQNVEQQRSQTPSTHSPNSALNTHMRSKSHSAESTLSQLSHSSASYTTTHSRTSRTSQTSSSSSMSPFDASKASAELKTQEGYVSFADIQGLGSVDVDRDDEDEDEKLNMGRGRAERRGKWALPALGLGALWGR